MSAIVRFPEKPYKRYWVAKVYDDEVANKQVFSVLNPKWCQPEILKCQFPADMKVSEQVKQRGESMKPAESDWITFSYVYFSQTGKIILWFVKLKKIYWICIQLRSTQIVVDSTNRWRTRAFVFIYIRESWLELHLYFF